MFKFFFQHVLILCDIVLYVKKTSRQRYVDVGQNPVPPVNLKVDGHPLYHMISRFWPIPMYFFSGVWLYLFTYDQRFGYTCSGGAVI